ncbi:hypothetical protein AB0E25_41610, partial [Streptomyces bobili]
MPITPAEGDRDRQLNDPSLAQARQISNAVSGAAARDAGPVWSHSCTLDELFLPYDIPAAAVARLSEDPRWLRTWTTEWKAGKAKVVVPVRDLGGAPTMLSVPVRRFSWRAGQRHRPGLEFMVSTGRQQGFESWAERRLLLVSKRDLLLAIAHRPRLAALYAEVEHARGDSFLPDRRISDLIEQSRLPTAPDPGIVLPDDGPDMDLLERQIRTALQQPPRKASTWPPARPPAPSAVAALRPLSPPTFLPKPSSAVTVLVRRVGQAAVVRGLMVDGKHLSATDA